MANGKSAIENFDVERGDVLVLRIDMAQALTRMGQSVASRILWQFTKWFAGGEDTSLRDPRDDAILDILKRNQRKCANYEYGRRLKQREKAVKRWNSEPSAADADGMPRDAAASKENENETTKEEKQKASLPSPGDSAPSACDAGSVAPGALIPFPSPRYTESRARASRNPDESNWTLADLDGLGRDPVTTILRFIREESRPYSRNTLNKFIRLLGKGAVIDTFIDMIDEEEGSAAGRGKTLFRRLRDICSAQGAV